MSRNKDDSWIKQPKKKIEHTDDDYKNLGKRGDMPSWQGPSKPKKISGNRNKWKRKQHQEDYFDTSPNISASKRVTKKNLSDTSNQIDDLKKSTKKKLNTGLAPPKNLTRNTTIPSPPKNLPTKAKKKETSAEVIKRNQNLTRKFGPGLRKQVGINEQKKKEDWKLQQRLQRQQKDLITRTAIRAEEAFYNFLNREWRARHKAPGKNDEAFLSGKKGQGTKWKYIKPHYTFRAVGLDNFIKNHNKYTIDIENLNTKIFKNVGERGKRYYQQLKKWNTDFFELAQKKKDGEKCGGIKTIYWTL